MKKSTRASKLYVEGDILTIKNKTDFITILGNDYGRWCGEYQIDKSIHNFKGGKVFWTYLLSRDGYIPWKREFTEGQLERYFTCNRVLKIIRDNKLKLII